MLPRMPAAVIIIKFQAYALLHIMCVDYGRFTFGPTQHFGAQVLPLAHETSSRELAKVAKVVSL